MSYINTYGVYLPHFTISDDVLHPGGRKNNHAIAYVDEDIITLAYQAAVNAGPGIQDVQVDAVLFATTTPVFKDRYHASYLAGLLGLPDGIMAIDMGTTNRAGTDALLLADTMVESGKYGHVLVVAADISFPVIGEEAKTPFGHGAVAILVSKDRATVKITTTRSFSAALAEAFTYKREQALYDPRFARTAGFKEFMKRVMIGLDPQDINCLIINSAYVKLISGALKKAGFDMEKQVAQDALIPQCGYTGSAHGLLRLVNAIESTTGTSVLIDYNNGANLLAIDNEKPPEKMISGQLAGKVAISSYQDYLTLRKQGDFESGDYKSVDIFSSEMMQEREKEQLVKLRGFRCRKCKTVYYLKSARCNHCKCTDLDEAQLSRSGTVYTLTSEHYFPSSFPPTHMAVIDLDGGGRMTVQQTDDVYQDNPVRIGDKVELVLRKMMENDRKPNYFWKCRLTRDEA